MLNSNVETDAVVVRPSSPGVAWKPITLLFALVLLLAACGDDGDDGGESESSSGETAEQPADEGEPDADDDAGNDDGDATPESGTDDAPTAESVTVTFDGEDLNLDTIVECPATPGFALGFSANSGQTQAFGGFEEERGQVTLIVDGTEWRASTESDLGLLSFELTDTTADGNRPFVTVTATGVADDGTGATKGFTIETTCEPGGT